LEKVADVWLTNSLIGASTTVAINALKFLHRARAERDYLLITMDEWCPLVIRWCPA